VPAYAGKRQRRESRENTGIRVPAICSNVFNRTDPKFLNMKILRTLTRVCVNDIADTLQFYERLSGTKAGLRFTMPGAGLELASVGDVLIIAGTDDALRPFRSTNATFLVDSVEEFHRFLMANGGTIIRPPQVVPTGMNMIVRHPDGSVIEYVEHRQVQPTTVPVPEKEGGSSG